LKQPRDKAALI